MRIKFRRKTFVFLGQLESMNQHEAWKKVQELGGYVSSTPRPSSDYIVLGRRPGKKLALVEKVGKPTLTEAEFLAAIKTVETGRVEGEENVEVSDAVAGLRELLSEAPSQEVWGRIQALLDQSTPAQLDLVVDYTEQHISQWPNGDEHPGAPLPLAFEAAPAELRTFSVAWRNLALAGERSPRLQLGRSLNLSKMELRGEAANHITDHPDLMNLRSLDIGASNQLDASFFESLRRSVHLPRLTSLTLRHLTIESATALCGEHNMASLRHVMMAGLTDNSYAGGSSEIYDELFSAEWWGQIEGLACCTASTYGYPHFHRSLYPQLARNAHRMVSLRHLVLEDTNHLEELLQTELISRLHRLSLALCQAESSEQVLEHLAARREEHTVETLDLSRGIFLGAHYRPNKHASPPQKSAVEKLLQHADWGALKQVVVEASLLGVRIKKKLDAWGEKAGIAISASPWKA